MTASILVSCAGGGEESLSVFSQRGLVRGGRVIRTGRVGVAESWMGTGTGVRGAWRVRRGGVELPGTE